MIPYVDTVIVFGGQSRMTRGQQYIVQYNPDLSLWSRRENVVEGVTGPMMITAFADMACDRTVSK